MAQEGGEDRVIMETALWSDILKMAAGAGLGTLLLVAAVWYLQRNNGILLGELKVEREQRIALLEADSKQCKADRLEQQKQITALQNEITNIYKTRGQQSMLDQAERTQNKALVHTPDQEKL